MSDVKELPKLTRTAPVALPADFAARAKGDDGELRIPVAISSEYEVKRWFGGEILAHDRGAIDSTYLDLGMAVLLDHDTRRHIGRVENWSLGSDKVLRGEAVFDPEDADARRAYGKVARGFLPFTSVGYRLNEMVLARSGDDGDTYRATSWTPYEVSFVAVPADPTVGAGRNSGEALFPVTVRPLDPAPEVPAAPPTEPAPEARSVTVPEESAAATGAAPTITVGRSDNDEAFRDLAAAAELHGMQALFATRVGEGKSPSEIRAEMNTEIRSRLARGPVQNPLVTLTPKEEREYSLARAILAAAGENADNSFEREVHEELMRKLGRSSTKGFLFPTNIRAGLDSATSTKGTELKFTQEGSFVDMLRKKARVLMAGATYLPGLDGPITFPKQNGAGTASWVGENPGSDVSDSNLTLTTVSMTAKTIQSTTSFSKQLLRQSSVNVENLVRDDLAKIHALAIDLAAINGSGSSNQPQGVLQNTSVNVVAIGTNGGAPTYDYMVDLETAVENDDADIGPSGYISTPGVKGKLKKTQRFSSTDGAAVWEGGQVGQVNGYPAFSTNQVPSNLTKGTSTTVCHAVLYGVWSQLYVGEWGAAEILVDPYALKKQGMIEVTSFQMVDIMLRHPEAFAVIKDATI